MIPDRAGLPPPLYGSGGKLTAFIRQACSRSVLRNNMKQVRIMGYRANIIKTESIGVRGLEVYHELTEPQLLRIYEPEAGLFIAETPMIIERALAAGYEPESMLVEEGCTDAAAKMLAEAVTSAGPELTPDAGHEVPVYTASSEILTSITGFRLTRGMLAAMRRRPRTGIESVCEGTRRIAVLEEVMNPTNLGAIFRSAAALGIEAVLLTPGCTDPLYRRAARVSMGTVFVLPWAYLSTGAGYIDILHDMGYKAVSMALRHDSVSIGDPVLKHENRLAIILGTEGEGLREDTILQSDYTVRIPMSRGVDSLNVGAAGAIAFWELGRVSEEE